MTRMREFYGVTTEGKCVIFKSGISGFIYAGRRNLNFAVLYERHVESANAISIYTGHDTWNGNDHGIFTKYLADYRINKTNEMCVELIKNNC